MSELSIAPAETPGVVDDPDHVIEAVRRAPILITKHAVALSTAPAVPLPRTTPTRKVIAALGAMFLSSRADAHPVPRHYPPRRDSLLEQAATEREMHRL